MQLSGAAPAGYAAGMRCRLCGEWAGWLQRGCADCRRLWRIWQERRPAAMGDLLDAFLATGVGRPKIDRFLAAKPHRGQGAIRDQIVADVANSLLSALGQPGAQTGASVERLRRRGAWKGYDRPPEAG